MNNLGSLSRYQSGFKKLLVILSHSGVPLETISIQAVAEGILTLSTQSLHDARNAYCAALLLPGFSSLRFSSLLQGIKKRWNVSVQKYASFWDPSPLLAKLDLSARPLHLYSIDELRKRLIICWRILSLHRGVDLSRTQRTVSLVGGKIFVLVQRKGWQFPKWEEVISLPEKPHLSPWHLMQEYVRRTAHLVSHRKHLLWSLDGKKPLSSNRVNSLTKEILQSFQVDTAHWKAHSTRGAGVMWWKKVGLAVEEVQQLGQWKNFSAFQAHYLRLGVVERVQQVMNSFGSLVHNSSPSGSAESDWSRTPGTQDPGGRDREDEAQQDGEPTQPTQRGGDRKNRIRFAPYPPGPRRFTFKTVSEPSPPTPAPKSQ